MTLLRKENTICRVTDNLIKGDGCCHTPAQFVGTKSFLISKDGNNVDETHKEISMEFYSFMNLKKSRSQNLENPDVSENILTLTLIVR